MRREILGHRLGASGVLPPATDLLQELGVSRTVLREALGHLQAEGLIEVSHGRRSRVLKADPRAAASALGMLLQRTPGSMEALLEVRRPMESEIAALAAQRATPEHRDALAKAVADLEHAPDLEAQVEADVRFHRELARATGNPVYMTLIDTLNELLTESRYRTIGAHGIAGALEGHRKILDVVLAGRPEDARRVMLEHLGVTAKELKD